MFVAVCATSFAWTAFALDPKTSIRNYIYDVWEIESGLPQNSVMSIVQTRDGYLWLGTQEGLARFDGVRFVAFNQANTPALRSNHVQTLVEDGEGQLWIGTYGGGLTRMKDGRFETFGRAEGLSNDFVRALWQDRKGTLWIGTNEGVTRLQNGKFTIFGANEGLSNPEVISLGGDAQGRLWAGTYGGGVFRLDDDFGKQHFTPFTTDDGLAHGKVWAIYTDRAGNLWIGTAGGLNVFRDGKLTSYTKADGLPNDVVQRLLEDRDGNLWIATRSGIARWENGSFESFDAEHPLREGEARAIYEDVEGNLWIGTYGGGLSRLKNRVVSTITRKDGLSEDVTRAIYEDKQGAIWIGTYGAGVNRFANGTFTRLSKSDGLAHDRVWSLMEDGAGALWLGTFGGGIHRVDGSTFTSVTEKEGLPDDVVRSMYRASDGTLWIGTAKGLASLRDGKVQVSGVPGLRGTKVVAMYDDGRGTFWAGTDKGLWRLAGNRATLYTANEGLSHDLVYAIHGDRDGTIWVGTRGGLTRIKGTQFTRYTKRDGLFDDAVFHILEDDRNNLWMSSSRGIFRIAKRELDEFAAGARSFITSVAFGKADGMKSSECNGGFQPAGLKSRDGRLWFPTMRGVAIIDPRHVQTNPLAPPVFIEQMIVDGAAVSANALLAPKSRQFEFHYTGLSFTAPEKVHFKYQLVGFDQDWVDAGTRRVAYYTNIPPGSYRFRVAACNNDGVWNEQGATVSFALRPAFYNTGWFYALVATAIVFISALVYRLRIRRLQVREKELVALVDERTHEIERERNEAEHLAYHDTLTQLPNRLLYIDRLELAIGRAQRRGEQLAVLFLDLDRFKNINDSLGHSVGDQLLLAVAHRLQSGVRQTDTVARFGGDEYTLLLETVASPQDADRLARKIVEWMHAPFTIDSHELVVTTSVGLALYPDDGVEAETLLKNADAAMYRAKELGRNHHQRYAPTMNAESAGHLAMETLLRKALHQGDLMLHYQPIIDSASGRLLGAEALLRCRHPEKGILAPADFLRTAEVSGMILPIGAWVLSTACAQARAWQEAFGSDFRICVNLSARQFQQSGLLDQVDVALVATGLDPRLLELEITEHDAMQNAEAAVGILRELKALGVRIAIDDFGTGHSSLSYLRQFPIDTLKLDQSFVHDVTRSFQDGAIVEAVIHLAHTLDLEVIAEGVETLDQLTFLRTHRCDAIQGYYFSVPLDAEAFAKFAESRSNVA